METLIDTLYLLLLVVLIVAGIMLITVLWRANHLFSKWTRVSDIAADSLSKIIPAFLNIATIGAAVRHLLRALKTQHSKKDKR